MSFLTSFGIGLLGSVNRAQEDRKQRTQSLIDKRMEILYKEREQYKKQKEAAAAIRKNARIMAEHYGGKEEDFYNYATPELFEQFLKNPERMRLRIPQKQGQPTQAETTPGMNDQMDQFQRPQIGPDMTGEAVAVSQDGGGQAGMSPTQAMPQPTPAPSQEPQQGGFMRGLGEAIYGPSPTSDYVDRQGRKQFQTITGASDQEMTEMANPDSVMPRSPEGSPGMQFRGDPRENYVKIGNDLVKIGGDAPELAYRSPDPYAGRRESAASERSAREYQKNVGKMYVALNKEDVARMNGRDRRDIAVFADQFYKTWVGQGVRPEDVMDALEDRLGEAGIDIREVIQPTTPAPSDTPAAPASQEDDGIDMGLPR